MELIHRCLEILYHSYCSQRIVNIPICVNCLVIICTSHCSIIIFSIVFFCISSKDLNESTLLENLQQRFEAGHIYTYVGSILIAVNPFKFHPIYNPKYVRLYQNQRVGPILPPHIFAIADNAYYCMLKEKRNQCVVISGESGSGKTESTNFLLHHLTALSQKGSHGSGVEQTILSAGPVLEAFGNAKTAHNNNSSRFGKFIQVSWNV